MFDALPTAKRHWIYSMIALQIPKTASSSIAKCLSERNLLEKHKGLIHDRFSLDPLYRGVFDLRHLVPSHIFSVFGRQVFDFFSFAVKREPFSRIESAFLFGKRNKLGAIYGLNQDCSFEQFVNFLFEKWEQKAQDILILKRQVEWTHSSIFRPTTILSFENLDNNWAKMLKDYHIDGLPTKLPRENVSDRSSLNVSWTPELKDKVYKIYEPDFDLLGYFYKY